MKRENGFLSTSRATKLMIFATVIAALRFMMLNGVAVGFDFWPWFKGAETISGVAFAVLEGVALAYISRRWRKLDPVKRTDWVYWSILLGGQVISLIAITWTVGMAFVVVRSGQGIDEVLTPQAAAWWSLMVAGLNPLILLLIGIVEDDEEAQPIAPLPVVTAKSNEATALEWIAKHGPTDPGSLAENAEVPVEVAVKVLGDLRSAFVVSEQPVKVKRASNGNGVAK